MAKKEDQRLSDFHYGLHQLITYDGIISSKVGLHIFSIHYNESSLIAHCITAGEIFINYLFLLDQLKYNYQ